MSPPLGRGRGGLGSAGLVEEGFPLEGDREAPGHAEGTGGGGGLGRSWAGMGDSRGRPSPTDGVRSLLGRTLGQGRRRRWPGGHERRREAAGGRRREGSGGRTRSGRRGRGAAIRGEEPRIDLLGASSSCAGGGIVLLGGDQHPGMRVTETVAMRRGRSVLVGIRRFPGPGGDGSGCGGGHHRSSSRSRRPISISDFLLELRQPVAGKAVSGHIARRRTRPQSSSTLLEGGELEELEAKEESGKQRERLCISEQVEV